MNFSKLVAVVAAIIVVAASAVVIHNATLAQEAAYFTPMKDEVMEFIASNHADAERFIAGITFAYQGGGTFSGGGWVLSFSGSAVSGTATADFSIARTQNSTGIPHRILWSGNITNGTVVETSYSHAV